MLDNYILVMISYISCRPKGWNLEGQVQNKSLKVFKKVLKNAWQTNIGCDIMVELSRQSTDWSQLTQFKNWIEGNDFSYRKITQFLSITLKYIKYHKAKVSKDNDYLVEIEPRTFKSLCFIQIKLKSLILAQDERWRRA